MMSDRIIRSFDAAAAGYDAAAFLQRNVAEKLVRRARTINPVSILDIGCGTGAVASLAAQKWPQAAITGIDASPAMLQKAQKKVPGLTILQADAADLHLDRKFDLIFSSMLLHWLPRPDEVLENWTKFLNPGGTLHVALPVAGSLGEWRTLCRAHHLEDGLWNFPAPDFAKNLMSNRDLQSESVTYGDLRAFLDSLKQTGAHQSRGGHAPFSAAKLRRLLNAHRGPFTARFDILYLSVPVP